MLRVRRKNETRGVHGEKGKVVTGDQKKSESVSARGVGGGHRLFLHFRKKIK